MTRPTDAELLRIAITPDPDVELDRVMRMSDEEIRESLKARGYDLQVLEAEADMYYAMIQPKKVRAGYIAGGVALFGAAAIATTAVFMPAATPAVITAVAVAAGDPAATEAQSLREEALGACDRQEWKTCLDKLDRARELDPTGEGGRVIEARRRAAEGLGKRSQP